MIDIVKSLEYFGGEVSCVTAVHLASASSMDPFFSIEFCDLCIDLGLLIYYAVLLYNCLHYHISEW